MNLNDFHDLYYLPAIARLRECTRIGYESAWHLHLEPQLGGVEMEELSSEIVAMWLQGFESA
jgi:hypothetical protein